MTGIKEEVIMGEDELNELDKELVRSGKIFIEEMFKGWEIMDRGNIVTQGYDINNCRERSSVVSDHLQKLGRIFDEGEEVID
jgi:hypothetical protein